MSINSNLIKEQLQLLFNFSNIEKFINTIKKEKTSTSNQRDVVLNDEILNENIFAKQHDISSVIETISIVSRIKIIRSNKTQKNVTTHQFQDVDTIAIHDFLLDFTLIMTLFTLYRISDDDVDDDVVNCDNMKIQVDKKNMSLNDNKKIKKFCRYDFM